MKAGYWNTMIKTVQETETEYLTATPPWPHNHFSTVPRISPRLSPMHTHHQHPNNLTGAQVKVLTGVTAGGREYGWISFLCFYWTFPESLPWACTVLVMEKHIQKT